MTVTMLDQPLKNRLCRARDDIAKPLERAEIGPWIGLFVDVVQIDLGFVDLLLGGNADFKGEFEVALKDPDNSDGANRITLRELFEGIISIGTIVTLCGEDDRFILRLEKVGELGDRRCLPRTVDSGDQDDRRFLGRFDRAVVPLEEHSA